MIMPIIHKRSVVKPLKDTNRSKTERISKYFNENPTILWYKVSKQ